MLGHRGKPRESRFEFGLLGFDFGFAGFGQREAAARATTLNLFGQPHVGEQRQQRVKHAGAGGISLTAFFGERADQLVAVLRAFGEQREDHQPQLIAREALAASPVRTAAATITIGVESPGEATASEGAVPVSVAVTEQAAHGEVGEATSLVEVVGMHCR